MINDAMMINYTITKKKLIKKISILKIINIKSNIINNKKYIIYTADQKFGIILF